MVADIVRNIILHYVCYLQVINITAFDRKVDKGFRYIVQSMYLLSHSQYCFWMYFIIYVNRLAHYSEREKAQKCYIHFVPAHLCTCWCRYSAGYWWQFPRLNHQFPSTSPKWLISWLGDISFWWGIVVV